MTLQIKTDYLVIGSGAMGMAFVDTLLDEMPDADIVMVDRSISLVPFTVLILVS